MASLTRRFALAATALAFLLLVMPALASATITVTNTNDTGAGSLRAAITTANGSPTVATTINFSVSGTITLGSALPAIANSSPNGSLTIDGSGQAITVYGVSSYQIFSVNSGATLNLRNLTINDGLATDGGGADNAGILTVTNCTFSDNFADLGGGIDNEIGGTLTVTNTTFAGNVTPNGLGGGISNDGGMTVTNSTFSNNSTGGGEGGGIYSDTMLTVTNSTFSGNSATGGLGGGGIQRRRRDAEGQRSGRRIRWELRFFLSDRRRLQHL
jgi:predicted outer membrane repeat protein